MFDFVYWLRDRVLAAAAGLPADELGTADTINGRDLRATLIHELDVEWSWRERLQGIVRTDGSATELLPHDYRTVADIADHWRRDEVEMRAWLAELSDEQLASDCAVEGNAGYPLATFVAHIVMHAVEQFTDAAILLTRAGHSPGDLEFLDFWDSRLERPADA
jgi:uncharacterized damage-inducible protein DinB